MQSFRTELENPLVQKDIIELEKKIRLFHVRRFTEFFVIRPWLGKLNCFTLILVSSVKQELSFRMVSYIQKRIM